MAERINKQTGEVSGAPSGFIEYQSGSVLSHTGDTLQGVYRGTGKDVTVKRGKKTQRVRTYTVETPSGEVTVFASAQLDGFFKAIPTGSEVWIRRGDQVDGKNGKVNTYKMAWKKAVKAKRR